MRSLNDILDEIDNDPGFAGLSDEEKKAEARKLAMMEASQMQTVYGPPVTSASPEQTVRAEAVMMTYGPPTMLNHGQGTLSMAMMMTMNTSQPKEVPPPHDGKWYCQKCGAENTGKFCCECGDPANWRCPNCGNILYSKFCTDCGAKKPE